MKLMNFPMRWRSNNNDIMTPLDKVLPGGVLLRRLPVMYVSGKNIPEVHISGGDVP